MLLNTKTDVKRSGMILLIVVAFLSMFLVVGTTYLLVADSIRRTSDFDLNATDKRSDYALMPDIDPRYMFNFALGQVIYDVVEPTAFDQTTGKLLTTNSAFRGQSLATNMYGVYEPQPITKATATATVNGGQISSISVVLGGSGYTVPPRIIIEGGGGFGATALATLNVNGQVSAINIITPGSNYTSSPNIYIGVPNDRPFQGAGKNPVSGELDYANYKVFGLTTNGGGVRDPEKGFRGSPPVYTRWNPQYNFPDKNNAYLARYIYPNRLRIQGKVSNDSDLITNVIPVGGNISDLAVEMPIDFIPGSVPDDNLVTDAHPPFPFSIKEINKTDPANITIKLNKNFLPDPPAQSFNPAASRVFEVTLFIPSFHRETVFGPMRTNLLRSSTPFVSPPPEVLNSGNPNWLPDSWGRTADNNFVIDPNRHRTLRPRPFDQLTAAELTAVSGFPNPRDPEVIKFLNTKIANNQIFPYPEADGMDVKNLEGYPGGNDSIWIDAGFPVMTTSDGRKYKALIAPLILDLDGRINLNVAGNLMQRNGANPYFADHASNQGWGRWEINPKKLIENYSGTDPLYSPLNPANEFLNLLSFGTTSGNPATTFLQPSPIPPLNQWKTFGRFFKADYLPINSNPPPATNFSTTFPHSYAQVDFNAAGDCIPAGPMGTPPKNWGSSTTKPTFVNANGFPSFGNGNGFGNGQASEYLFDGVTPGFNYHARNYNPYRTQSNVTGPNTIDVSTVFPVSETASVLRWQGKGEPFSKSQLAQLLPKSLGLDMPYNTSGMDGIFRQRIRNMVTTLSADLDRPAMVPIIPDTYAHTLRFGDFLFPERTVAVTIPNADLMPPVNPPPMPPIKGYNPIGDAVAANPNLTSPALKVNLSRYLTPFPNLVQDNTNTTDRTNYIDYASNSGIFIKAQDDRTKFATELFDALRNVTGIIKYESVITNPAFAGDLLEIKKSNRWLAQLAANIVDFIDADDFNTVFNWYLGDTKDVVFGVELPRVVINEVYSMAQNDSTDTFNNNQNATLKTHIYTAIELMNPLPTDGIYGVGPGGHNAVLQFKDSTGTEYQNYRLVLCKSGQVSGQMNAVNGNYFNNTGAHDFNGTNIAMDSNGMGKAILDNWTNPNIMPVANMVPAAWYLRAGDPIVVSDDTTLRTEAEPGINAPFKTSKIKLKLINKDQDPNDDNAPEVMLQKLVYPGLPHNDYDTMTNMLTDGALPYNPYITVDIFSKRKMWDLRKFNETAARNPDVTITSSKGRKSPFLDSAGMDISDFSKNMYNGNNSGNQQPQPPPPVPTGAKHSMGQPNSNAQNLPWLAHLDRQLINPLELIHVSTVKPHELTQTANRWDIAFNQKCLHPVTNTPVINQITNVPYFFPTLTKYPYAHNWPWFDENTRLYRFLEAVGVSPLQAGEAMHGRALGKVNVNTMHGEEVFQAVADAAVANNFAAGDVTTAYNCLNSQNPILGFGQPNNTDFSSATSKKGLNKSLLGYKSFDITNAANAEVPFGNLLDVQGFSASGPSPAIYPRKELLTKIGNSVTTKSNVFAVWITTGYFEVRDDSTQPPKLGAEIGKADGINIRHRMFAIVDRTNMVTGVGASSVAVPAVGLVSGFTGNLTHPNGKTTAIQNGMILTFDPNTDNEETVQLSDVGGGVLGATFSKTHAVNCTIINRGNPGPWVGYDRTKDRDVVPYAEIIE